MTKVRELLTDESKWRKGYDSCIEGPMCLYVAMIRCNLRNPSPEYSRVKQRIGGGDITTWNDAPERTFQDVKALIEELDI